MKALKFFLAGAVALLVLSFINKPVAEGNVVWHTDVKKAVEIAKKEDKPIFFFFTGSDWCGWCIRLQKKCLKHLNLNLGQKIK